MKRISRVQILGDLKISLNHFLKILSKNGIKSTWFFNEEDLIKLTKITVGSYVTASLVSKVITILEENFNV